MALTQRSHSTDWFITWLLTLGIFIGEDLENKVTIIIIPGNNNHNNYNMMLNILSTCQYQLATDSVALKLTSTDICYQKVLHMDKPSY